MVIMETTSHLVLAKYYFSYCFPVASVILLILMARYFTIVPALYSQEEERGKLQKDFYSVLGKVKAFSLTFLKEES